MAIEEKAAYRWPMLAYLFLIGLVVNGFVVYILPPVFPRIAADMGLNTHQKSALVAGQVKCLVRRFFLHVFLLLGGENVRLHLQSRGQENIEPHQDR